MMNMSSGATANAENGGHRTNRSDDKIIIIGAGATGCALAHGLKKADIPFAIFEARDDANPTRDWSMGLHWALPALEALTDKELFAKLQTAQVNPHAPPNPVEHIPMINGETGQQLGMLPTPNLRRLCRSKFRKLLISGLDVQWGKTVVDVVYSADGTSVIAIFSDGTREIGSLLVGSDGPRSTVRSLLLGPEKAQIYPIDFATTHCFQKYSREQALYLQSVAHHPFFEIAPHPQGYFGCFGLHEAPDPDAPEGWTFWHYISFPEPRDEKNEKSKREHTAHQKALGKTFAKPLKSALEWLSDDNPDVYYSKLQHWDPEEEGHAWKNMDGRITLAGDAAHPMTFQRGQGLNHAITDSLRLFEAIKKFWDNGQKGIALEKRADAVSGYEKEMVARSGEEVRLGEKNSKMLHDWDMVMQSPAVTKGMGALRNEKKT